MIFVNLLLDILLLLSCQQWIQSNPQIFYLQPELDKIMKNIKSVKQTKQSSIFKVCYLTSVMFSKLMIKGIYYKIIGTFLPSSGGFQA